MMNLIVYILGLLGVWGTYFTSGPTFYVFVVFFLVHFILYPAKRAFSPLSIFYAYYGLWYVVAPLYAGRYQDKLFLAEYSLSVAMVYTVFGLGILAIRLGAKSGQKCADLKLCAKDENPQHFSYKVDNLKYVISFLYVTSTVLVFMIIYSSGGVTKWIENQGDAFLNRAGSGVYVVLSHFSSILLALLSGYFAYNQRRILYLYLFFVWVFLTCPVHGSKMQISLLIILACLPWLREMRLKSFRSMLLYGLLVVVFLVGLYSRSQHVDFATVAKSSLNYFSTLENLAVSVRDFEPSFLKTFFLPFEKFKTPIGLSRPDLYYDMNHYLTDIYYPEAWKIRATEQWPVETDMYLNFKFYFGLPLVFFYLWILGYFYGRAIKKNNLGQWGVSFLMTITMISHLRGSLINHIDFYMYPFILILYVILRKFSFSSEFYQREKGFLS
ncbi:MAG: polymerase [Pseudobdellovibrio sp.]